MYRARAVASLLAAVLASVCAAASPTAAPARTDGPLACTPLTTDFGKGALTARPSYPDGEATPVSGSHFLVHYTMRGADAPPLADVAPANGQVDYVESVRDAAEEALAFFAAPSFNGQPFPGFDPQLCDGGPDPRIDIYIKDLGKALGRSASPTRAEGGSFVTLSPRLSARARGSSEIFKGDGIRFTVAHELFHVVQFQYVPAVLPLWIAEGTANTLAFFFEGVDHPDLLKRSDIWLRTPWKPLWYEDFNCDRCYGGLWWWGAVRNVLRPYFERLAENYRDGFGIGKGVAALQGAYEDALPGDWAFATQKLNMDFAFSFAVALARTPFPKSVRPPPDRYTFTATRKRQTKQIVLQPMSIHYISIHARAEDAGLEVTSRATQGPDPLETLLVGYRRRVGRAATVTQIANPCLLTFPPGYADFADRIAVNLSSKADRENSLLVVANRGTTVVRYTLTLASVGRRFRVPSPNEDQSGKRLFCEERQSSGSAADRLGDGEDGIPPDVDRIDVAATTLPGTAGQQITFAVRFPNRAELLKDDLIDLLIDADRNPRTGCAGFGAEYALVVAGVPGADTFRFGRCVGGEISLTGSQGSFHGRFDGAKRTLILVTSRDDLGKRSAFNFRVDAAARDAAGNWHSDSLPELGSAVCFPCRGAATASAAMIVHTHASTKIR